MDFVKAPVSDWRSRHPFTVGQKIWPRIPEKYPTLTDGRKISMRGESERGLYVLLENIAYEFPASDFISVAPMPAVSEAEEREAI